MRRRARRPENVIALATLAAGPFEKAEAVLRDLPGVIDTAVGYAGGFRANPTYALVQGGTTGHVEAVQIHFDPRRVFYAELLEAFWLAHDPTALPLATHHRSVIFVHSPEQHDVARLSRLVAHATLRRPLVTEIRRASTFYRAEDEHQQVIERGLLLTPA